MNKLQKKIIDLDFENKCNNNCVMCILEKEKLRNFSTEEIKNYIRSFKSIEEIYLTGGEPTIRKDFFEIVKYIKRKHPNAEIKLITNGRMFTYDWFTKKVARAKIFKIITEIHGSTSELHDKVTNVKGSFDQTIKGVKNMLKNNLRVEIRIVIHKLNYKNLPKLAKFICSNFKDIERVIMFPIDIKGTAYVNRKKVVVNYRKIKKYVQKAINEFNKNKLKIKLYHYPFCVIDKKYWEYVEGVTKNVNDLKLTPKCKICRLEKKCPRIWKTYFNVMGEKEFKSI